MLSTEGQGILHEYSPNMFFWFYRQEYHATSNRYKKKLRRDLKRDFLKKQLHLQGDHYLHPSEPASEPTTYKGFSSFFLPLL